MKRYPLLILMCGLLLISILFLKSASAEIVCGDCPCGYNAQGEYICAACACWDNDNEITPLQDPHAVPEPATMLLFSAGLAGAALRKKFNA